MVSPQTVSEQLLQRGLTITRFFVAAMQAASCTQSGCSATSVYLARITSFLQYKLFFMCLNILACGI